MSKCNKEINHGSQNVLGVLTWVELVRKDMERLSNILTWRPSFAL
jgi:hypothetical protein